MAWDQQSYACTICLQVYILLSGGLVAYYNVWVWILFWAINIMYCIIINNAMKYMYFQNSAINAFTENL